MGMNSPDFILFAQHGWADTAAAIAAFAESVAPPNTAIIAPNLGWFKTWLRIEPLIEYVEGIVSDAIARYPNTPIRIIGHSMGGLIWLELLHRHPQWRSRVESMVLVASPIGGADIARLLDPWEFGLGIARDLARNRRAIAESLAAEIPILVVAGDIGSGSDGLIPVSTAQCDRAQFTILPGLWHDKLKNSPQLIPLIRSFWDNPVIPPPTQPSVATHLIQRLQSVPGITDAHWRDFRRARLDCMFKDGTTLHFWRHPLGFEHIFVGDDRVNCRWGGFVSWGYTKQLQQTLIELKQDFD
ncbi:MAG: alpha/beta fold hydrolase [Cyanobacteriota bacterium]|nr:alpha/beta fold hydrolase [Cyanobacteriota bacterium]